MLGSLPAGPADPRTQRVVEDEREVISEHVKATLPKRRVGGSGVGGDGTGTFEQMEGWLLWREQRYAGEMVRRSRCLDLLVSH